jgi:hypothetical protein
MKKSLFATTAIVAAFGFGSTAAQAQDASLSLSAFSEFYANYVDQDVSGTGHATGGDYDFQTNTEVEVNGEVTLDNGITAGMSVEFEADNNDGNGARDNVDENLIYLDGSFGRVEFGHEDGAAETMRYGATSVKAVFPGGYNNTTGTFINYIGNAPGATQISDSSDGTKVTYYTPRFAGIQAGVSLAPDSDQADVPALNTRNTAATAGQGQDHFEGGLNFVNSFNGFDLAVSLTGDYLATPNASVGVPNPSDPYHVALGAVLGFGGFEFGGAAAMGENTADDDVQAYDLGVAYSTGPWSVSLTGIYSQWESDATGAEDDFTEGQLGVNYALGSGVSVFATGTVGERDNDSAADNDYVSLLSGVGVSF